MAKPTFHPRRSSTSLPSACGRRHAHLRAAQRAARPDAGQQEHPLLGAPLGLARLGSTWDARSTSRTSSPSGQGLRRRLHAAATTPVRRVHAPGDRGHLPGDGQQRGPNNIGGRSRRADARSRASRRAPAPSRMNFGSPTPTAAAVPRPPGTAPRLPWTPRRRGPISRRTARRARRSTRRRPVGYRIDLSATSACSGSSCCYGVIRNVCVSTRSCSTTTASWSTRRSSTSAPTARCWRASAWISTRRRTSSCSCARAGSLAPGAARGHGEAAIDRCARPATGATRRWWRAPTCGCRAWPRS